MKHFTKIFGSLAVVLVFYSLIVGGFDLGQHRYQDAVPNLIIGFFWFLILGVVAAEQVSDAKFKAEMKFLDKTSAMLKALVEAEEAHKNKGKGIVVSGPDGVINFDEIADKFMECVKAVTGGKRAPTPEEQPLIAAQFSDLTGWTAEFVGPQTDDKGEVVLRQPDAAPGRSPAHEAARVRGDKARAKQIPVSDGDEPQKPLTKSQQRRKNTKLGIGPITDDEVRENKNAKRRAARAAKKAELEQTKLV